MIKKWTPAQKLKAISDLREWRNKRVVKIWEEHKIDHVGGGMTRQSLIAQTNKFFFKTVIEVMELKPGDELPDRTKLPARHSLHDEVYYGRDGDQ